MTAPTNGAPTIGAPKLKRSMGLWVGYTLRSGLEVPREDNLFTALVRALDVPELRLFETGGDA